MVITAIKLLNKNLKATFFVLDCCQVVLWPEFICDRLFLRLLMTSPHQAARFEVPFISVQTVQDELIACV